MEQKDGSMPLPESELTVGETHSRRVIAVGENYSAQCCALRRLRHAKGGQADQSRLSALENQCRATLAKLREMKVDSHWLTSNGNLPRWLELFKESGEILEETKEQYGAIPLGSPNRLHLARQNFLKEAVFARPPDDESNDSLLAQMEMGLRKVKRMQEMGRLANAMMRDLFR